MPKRQKGGCLGPSLEPAQPYRFIHRPDAPIRVRCVPPRELMGADVYQMVCWTQLNLATNSGDEGGQIGN
jgi:hypothetical protein